MPQITSRGSLPARPCPCRPDFAIGEGAAPASVPRTVVRPPLQPLGEAERRKIADGVRRAGFNGG